MTTANKIEIGKTGRGFALGQFVDRYKQQCSVQDSSLATEAAIWLGVDEDLNGKECTRMHLTTEMVQALLPVLERFVRTGTITEEVIETGGAETGRLSGGLGNLPSQKN